MPRWGQFVIGVVATVAIFALAPFMASRRNPYRRGVRYE
jgi:hypothetical protein